jgi:hypothetical protein
MVPGALVAAVAVTVNVHAAPVPRIVDACVVVVIVTARVPGAVSAPPAATTVSGVITRFATSIVRGTRSSAAVPAALVKPEADADKVQPAPDPRGSIIVQARAVPVERSSPLPSTTADIFFGADTVDWSPPEVIVISTFSGWASRDEKRPPPGETAFKHSILRY